MTWADDARTAIQDGERLLIVAAAEISDLQAQVAELQAELDGQTPAPTGKSVFGFAGPDPTGKATVKRIYLNPGDPFPKPENGVLHFVTYKGPNDHSVRAQQVRTYGAPLLYGFHHEPEGPGSADYTPGAYKAHWAAMDAALNQVGATNVKRTWCMMGSSYTGKPGSTAENYYPGNLLVDVCAADGYDWCGCKTNSGLANPTGSHRMFGVIFKGLRDFAAQHAKEVAIGEVGTPARKDNSETDRVAFVNDMIATVVSDPRIIAVCYFQHGMPQFACDWMLKGASLQAYEAAL